MKNLLGGGLRLKLHKTGANMIASPPVKYINRKLYGNEEGGRLIYDLLNSGKPCMICRYGSVELSILSAAAAYPNINSSLLKKRISRGEIYKNAGFFPEGIEYILKYRDIMINASACADYIGVWFLPMEDFVIKHYANENIKLGLLTSLEPWYTEPFHWTAALEGKKVLVIHPFAETIMKQYKNREKLFDDSGILPQFELRTLKAVQTVAGMKDERFATWFAALEWMYQEALKIDFDIAIIGCGAYGFPLAAKIKSAGKQAIHMGGSTQILFGIKGKRWDELPAISKYYNAWWVRPSENEKPRNAVIVENGCYW